MARTAKNLTVTHIMMLLMGSSISMLSGLAAVRADHQSNHMPSVVQELPSTSAPGLAGNQPTGFAGDFLSSYHAQMEFDWGSAGNYLDRVIALDPDNPELVKRSMILSLGSGDIKTAARRAEVLLRMQEHDGTEALGAMIIAVDRITGGDHAAAREQLRQMATGDMTDFVRPLILGWLAAAKGKLGITGFNQTTIHFYHAAVISLFLKDKEKAREFTEKMSQIGGLGTSEIEKIADLYAAIGEREKALGFYRQIVEEKTETALEEKISAVSDKNRDLSSILPPLMIHTAAQGVAQVMLDMSFLLYRDETDSSTRLFAQMARALNPDLIEARLILADMLARNGRLEDAIAYFRDIPVSHKSYIPAQRYAAELLAQAGKDEEARALLNELFLKYNDVESLIRVGDLYRNRESYADALDYYNRAAGKIGGRIPEEYWYLLYARGMAYERIGDWSRAEADLKAALVFRPEHPYLLNYLGYGWADKGVNLEQSLQLIKRAVELRPADGYITDSLGWVNFMMGRYKEAVPPLERAVELLPYDPVINDHLGDAYWKTGRKVEARYQWQRAIGHSTDPAMKEAIQTKLDSDTGPVIRMQAARKSEEPDDAR